MIVVEGRRQNNLIVFNATRVVQQQDGATTAMTDWSVAGQLAMVGGHWLYSGIVASSQPGLAKLTMSPTAPAAAAGPAAAVRQYYS